jgi:hypothetical protein
MDENIETKLCKRCNAVKAITEFRINQTKVKLKETCVACDREKSRIYYANHKQIFKKSAQKYFKENKEKILAYKKTYEQENKEKLREASKKARKIWAEKNPDKVREYIRNTYMNKLNRKLAEEETKKMKGEKE